MRHRHRLCRAFLLDDHQIGVNDSELVVEVLDVSLDLDVDHETL